jgi:DNA invertase Pin-like site-specific DNA recombinase
MTAVRKKHPIAIAHAKPKTALKKGPALALVVPSAQVIGYARVSTEEQNLDVQITALKAAGAAKLYVEKISALNAKRPMFNLMMKFVERGDTVLFHSLSRMGRDVGQIIDILKQLTAAGVAWRSLTEPHLDNTTAAGRLMVNVTGAMAQFERDQIIERTKRGMDECRRKGMYLGRRKLFDKKQAAAIKRDRKRMTREQTAKKWRCSPGTIDKYAK